MKNRYEVMYVLRTDIEDGDHSNEISEFKSFVEREGGEVENIDEWGLRSLAYEVEHQSEGYYIIMEFSYETSKIPALEEKLKIADNVLRYLVVRKDA